jgi:hypothetical protein
LFFLTESFDDRTIFLLRLFLMILSKIVLFHLDAVFFEGLLIPAAVAVPAIAAVAVSRVG